MSVTVDPVHVLTYLNRLGYRHISADQLGEFIKDLKKLMKYDIQLHMKYSKSSVSRASSSIACSTNLSQYPSTSSHPDEETDYSSEKEVEYVHKRECNAKNSEKSGGLNSCSKEKENKTKKVTERPRSSFIKPWQLQASSSLRRSDPVALYHQYQSIWQQQKVPGDDGRAGLRWNVREKMMGEDPQPRPVPRAASAERVQNRKRGNSKAIRR